jgi:hypothetical protein
MGQRRDNPRMIRALSVVSLLLLGCGRSFVPGASAPGTAGAASALSCKGEAPFATPPKDLCSPVYGTLPELREAVVGSWQGTMRSTSGDEVFTVTVTFGADGTLFGTRLPRGIPLFGSYGVATYALDSVVDTCDAQGTLADPRADGKALGSLWWVRPCGDALSFAYSSVNAGLRVVETYRLERK